MDSFAGKLLFRIPVKGLSIRTMALKIRSMDLVFVERERYFRLCVYLRKRLNKYSDCTKTTRKRQRRKSMFSIPRNRIAILLPNDKSDFLTIHAKRPYRRASSRTLTQFSTRIISKKAAGGSLSGRFTHRLAATIFYAYKTKASQMPQQGSAGRSTNV